MINILGAFALLVALLLVVALSATGSTVEQEPYDMHKQCDIALQNPGAANDYWMECETRP